MEELPLAEFRAVMETNYFGVIRCIQAVLPPMRQRRSGCIINVASVAGHIAASPLAPYTASKFALEALSEALAQEAKPFNVRVAIVEPGIIDTPMSRHISVAQAPSPYSQQQRFAALFRTSLKNPVPRLWWRTRCSRLPRAIRGSYAIRWDPTPSRFSPGVSR